jgi:hypothetical protein
MSGHYLSLSLDILNYMKRKERYQGMFQNLPPSIRTEKKRVRFKNEIEWSMNHLKKDDRIIWYLSILQRFILFQIRTNNTIPEDKKYNKIGSKIKRKLKGWDTERIEEDFELFNHEVWEHFADIQSVFGSFKMLNYSFHNEVQNKLKPKTVREVFSDFQKMEQDLQNDNGRDRYCSDGEPVLTFNDGWAWFGVSEGFSGQEATAMRHCGNGEGGNGDYLLSLRQPMDKLGVTFWKPHLTFILNEGYLGEMKGFANQKPHPQYHSYIEALLAHEMIKGMKGGGYLPRNNFSFLDFEENVQIRVLEKKPDLEFDLIGNGGELKLEIPGHGAWYEYSDEDFPDTAASFVNEWSTRQCNWLVFQSSLSTSENSYRISEAWGFLEKGCLSNLHFEKTCPSREAVIKLLHSPYVEFLNEDLLNQHSSFNKILNELELEDLISKKPEFFISTPLSQLFERVGNSEALVKNLNHRYGSEFKIHPEGLILETYENLTEFAGRTGVGSMPRKILALGSPNEWPVEDIDLFQIPWLTLRRETSGEGESLYLFLHEKTILQFFETMNFEEIENEIYLLREIIFRFGPPDPTFCSTYSIAA